MKTFILLSCLALSALAAQAAEQVNFCKDARGKLVASDRPCGAEQAGQLANPIEAHAIDTIKAPDIFNARTKLREGDSSMPKDMLDRTDTRSVLNF